MDDKYIASLINKIEAKESEDSIEHKFDPRQLRDALGRWTTGVGASIQKKKQETARKESEKLSSDLSKTNFEFADKQITDRENFIKEQQDKTAKFQKDQAIKLENTLDDINEKQLDIEKKYIEKYGKNFKKNEEAFDAYWKEVSKVQKAADNIQKQQKKEEEAFNKNAEKEASDFDKKQISERETFNEQNKDLREKVEQKQNYNDLLTKQSTELDDLKKAQERTKEQYEIRANEQKEQLANEYKQNKDEIGEENARRIYENKLGYIDSDLEDLSQTQQQQMDKLKNQHKDEIQNFNREGRTEQKAESDSEYADMKKYNLMLNDQQNKQNRLAEKQKTESENLANEVAVQKKDLRKKYEDQYGEDFSSDPKTFKSYTDELVEIDSKKDTLDRRHKEETDNLFKQQKDEQEEFHRTMEEIHREAVRKEKEEQREIKQREKERQRAAEETRRQEEAEQRRQQQETAKQKAAEEAAKKYEEELKTMQATSQTLSAGKKFVSNLGGTVDLVMPRKTAKPLDLRGIESKELQDRINRYNLEQNYNSIFNIRQKELDAGRAKVTKGFNVAASIIGTAASAAALMIAIKQLRGK